MSFTRALAILSLIMTLSTQAGKPQTLVEFTGPLIYPKGQGTLTSNWVINGLDWGITHSRDPHKKVVLLESLPIDTNKFSERINYGKRILEGTLLRDLRGIFNTTCSLLFVESYTMRSQKWYQTRRPEIPKSYSSGSRYVLEKTVVTFYNSYFGIKSHDEVHLTMFFKNKSLNPEGLILECQLRNSKDPKKNLSQEALTQKLFKFPLETLTNSLLLDGRPVLRFSR